MKRFLKLGTKGLVTGAFIAGAAIIAAPMLAMPGKVVTNGTLVNTNDDAKYDYVPIDIRTGYNCATIIADSTNDSSTDCKLPNIYNVCPVDYPSTEPLKNILSNYAYSGTSRSALFLTDTAKAAATAGLGKYSTTPKGFDNPSDGYVTLTSMHQPDYASTTYPLRWSIPVNTGASVNNGMKLYDIEGHREGSFTFNDLGVYEQMYALCLVSNVPAGNDRAKGVTAKMQISYTDGTKSEEVDYTLYDWFYTSASSNLIASNGTTMNRCLLSVEDASGGGKALKESSVAWDNGINTTGVILNQCSIEVSTSKIVQSLDIALEVPQLSSTSDEIITLTVLGVTGQVPHDVLAPVQIKTQKTKDEGTTNYHDYVTWDVVEGQHPTSYFLDMWTQDATTGVKTMHSVYNNYEIKNDTQAFTDKKIEVTGLTANTKYYVQMRASNGTSQSANSNIDYIYTDAGCPLKVECTPKTQFVDSGTYDAKVGTTFQLQTVVTNDQTDPSPCADQNITWEIPSDYEQWISIEENAETKGSETAKYKIWDVVTKKPFTTQTLKAKSHADLAYEDTMDVNSTPNPITPTVSAKANHSATISWSNPEISDSGTDKNKFHLIVKNKTTQTSVYDGYVDYNSSNSGTTTKDLTGLDANTEYEGTARTVYSEDWSGTEPASPIYSGDPVAFSFTTTFNEAASLEVSPTTIDLSLGKTDTTKTVTTTVKSNDKKATFQEVTITPASGAEKYAEHTEGTFVEETPTTFTFKPLIASSDYLNWNISVDEDEDLQQTLQVKVNVDPTDAKTATYVLPDGFTANWAEAIRSDNTLWATGYIINLYKNDTLEQSVTISDPEQTSYTFTGLTYGTSYSYSVVTVNNGVKSEPTDKIPVVTATSKPTLLTVKKDSTTLSSGEVDVLVGSKTALTTEVKGQEFATPTGSKQYDVSDAKVNSSAPKDSSRITITDSDDGSVHTINALSLGTDGSGTDGFTLTTNIEGYQGQKLSQYIVVNIIPMSMGTTTATADSITTSWTDLKQYAADQSKLQYQIQISTEQTFTDPSQIVLNKTITDLSTQLTAEDLKPTTTYYIRGQYLYDGTASGYTKVQTMSTEGGINEFSLNKSTLTIYGNTTNTELVSTVVSDISGIEVEWTSSDENVCNIVEVPSTNPYTEEHHYSITGLNVGHTTFTVRPKGYEDKYERTCDIYVVKGTLEPLKAWADNITTNSFDLQWHPMLDKGRNRVHYKVNIWKIENGKKKYVLANYETADYIINLDPSWGIKTNTTYYCSVEAYNTYFETNTYNTVVVTLKDNVVDTSFPWWIVGASAGSAVGGWLLISYILYLFWKKSWLKTYDQDKVKDKVKGKKVKTHDKYFRVIDKACVATNIKVAKRSNSLMTRFGTQNEQNAKYKK